MLMADFILTGVDDNVLSTFCIGAILFFIALNKIIMRIQNSPRVLEGSQNVNSAHHSYNNEMCPICLGGHRFAVETNCGHKFCGSCLRSYLNRSSGDFTLFSDQLSCPLCRQHVNILLLNFNPEEVSSTELEHERYEVERTVHEYNVRFGGGPRTIWSYIRDCPVLIRHMFSDFFTFGRLLWVFRLRVLFCCFCAIIYLLNPFDILPEAMFGIFGFLDDVIVFVLCIIYVSTIYRRLIINRALSNN